MTLNNIETLMKAEELINNNSLSARDLPYVVNQDGKDQEIVFKEIALTAINMARRQIKEKAINAFLECDGYDEFERKINDES